MALGDDEAVAGGHGKPITYPERVCVLPKDA
jgi:hypothetical protein